MRPCQVVRGFEPARWHGPGACQAPAREATRRRAASRGSIEPPGPRAPPLTRPRRGRCSWRSRACGAANGTRRPLSRRSFSSATRSTSRCGGLSAARSPPSTGSTTLRLRRRAWRISCSTTTRRRSSPARGPASPTPTRTAAAGRRRPCAPCRRVAARSPGSPAPARAPRAPAQASTSAAPSPPRASARP